MTIQAYARTAPRKSAAARKLPEPERTFLDDYPDLYGCKCIGDCMAPGIPDGSKVAASKSMPYDQGDIVFVWLRPEVVKPGGVPALVKRLLMPPLSSVRFPYRESPKSEVRMLVGLGMDAQPGQIMFVPCVDILAIHRAVAVLVEGRDTNYRSILREDEQPPWARLEDDSTSSAPRQRRRVRLATAIGGP